MYFCRYYNEPLGKKIFSIFMAFSLLKQGRKSANSWVKSYIQIFCYLISLVYPIRIVEIKGVRNLLNKDEARLDSLILKVEKRLNRFEKNVSHMQKKITELKIIQNQIIEPSNKKWHTKAV